MSNQNWPQSLTCSNCLYFYKSDGDVVVCRRRKPERQTTSDEWCGEHGTEQTLGGIANVLEDICEHLMAPT